MVMRKKRKTRPYAPEESLPYRDEKPMEERSSGWSEWEIREALSVVARASKIQKNKKLMAAVRREAANQLKAAQATAQQVK